MSLKTLSFVIPTHKQEKTILIDIKRLRKSLDSISANYEIIIVADGKLSDISKIVSKLKDKRIKVIGYEKNKGKGHAVRFGMLAAKGDIVGFKDAGMDLDPGEIPLMLDIMDWNKADIVLGSKLHPDSKVDYPFFRKVLSWGYRTLTRILFGFKVKDTQVGLKLFKKKVAKDIFSRIIIKRFAFDIEVLAVASKLGYHKIYEAPVRLDFSKNTISNLNFWRVVFWMLWDTAAVFYRLRILHYYDKKQ
ncbi:MAG: hypothetical protein A2W22_05255 [Candidatus Levybacteria bacterium RBG_16_35_11]|nr:MAG: hypothetical protein A2W22_05255 [Candidatus Levybacteria bacterium RBG_16_35_11]